jgi:hypothetical protein
LQPLRLDKPPAAAGDSFATLLDALFRRQAEALERIAAASEDQAVATRATLEFLKETQARADERER